MCHANMEDFADEVNGSVVFSKFYKNEGFHQCELAEVWRHITTLDTHFGIFRYKRWSIRINATPEIFHNRIENRLLNGLEGTKNVMDYVLLHAKYHQEHDARCDKFLAKCEKLGLTLNIDKCVFGAPKVEFYGL